MAHGGSASDANGGGHHHFKDGAIDFFSASVGGVACTYVGQPLDTVKVKMQTFPNIHKNMIQCFFKTFREEGLARGLYAGTLPACSANVSENAVLFTAYGACQKFILNFSKHSNVQELSILQNASAGFLAAFFSSFVLCPTELVKCQLQALNESLGKTTLSGPKIGPFQLCKTIMKTEGIRGFYHGLLPTMMREMPGYFFFFGSYELTRELLRPEGKTKDEIGPLRTMFAGGVGGSVLWTLVFPADVLKSRIQVNKIKLPLVTVAKTLFKEKGILAFYNGLLPTVLRAFPATAALFVVYENLKKILHKATD